MREQKNEYALAGWMAIAAAVLILPSFVLSIATEVAKHRAPELAMVLLIPYFVVTICYTIAAIYAILQFRTLLNKRHGFHAIDGLITVIVLAFEIFLTGPFRHNNHSMASELQTFGKGTE